jgi:hypothetical protein
MAGNPAAPPNNGQMPQAAATTSPDGGPMPVAVATASPDSGQMPGAVGAIDWGVNASGWNVTVINNSPILLSVVYPDATNNVDTYSIQIGSSGGQGSVKGKTSIFGGPPT